MKTKNKDDTSVRSSISSTGDELPKHKTSPAKVSINESQEEPCEGIQNLRNLQKYVGAAKPGAAPLPEKAPQVAEAPQCAEPDSSKPAVEKSDSKAVLKRKPKEAPVNPFWTDTKRPDHPMLPIPRAPRTVEIRGGDVLGQCECVKRNGLQHDCPKWNCRGEELCLTWPIPTCQPSGLGVPIIVESRVKRPDSAHCELTAEEKKKAEKATAMEKRKEEVRLVEHARSNWKGGKDLAALQKAANQKSGYLKCNIHSGKYRLMPLMRDGITQTPDELCICPCDEKEDKEQTEVDKKAEHKSAEAQGNQKETVAALTAKKENPNMESVRTSTTGIPTAKKLKALIKPEENKRK